MTTYGSLTPEADVCPFCGCYPVEVVGRYVGSRYYVRCPECGSRTRYTCDRNEAIRLWNGRYQE